MPVICNRADLSFLLRDWLKVEALLDHPRFEAHSLETFDAVIDLAERIGTDLLAPALRGSDTHEPWIDEAHNVHVHDPLRVAVRAMAEAGLCGAAFGEDHGGAQLPFLIYSAAMGVLHAACSSGAFYIMLTVANARVLAAVAGPQLFEAFGAPQVAGSAFGTMCLSEPHAGSSLGDIVTKAVPDGVDSLGDRYRIKGNKMWISGGDQDVTDNIIHLVLAKIPDADGSLPQGSRGITLFVVPKILPDGTRNDVVVAGLNHKMGSRGLPNCALNIGEGFAKPDGVAGAVGWRVGGVGEGLSVMFQMMNEARISVGMASAMVAYRGYLLSLAYALERTQGRAVGTRGGSQIAIARHPDVRRMLLSQKAIVEGALALTLYAARLHDQIETASDAETAANSALLLGLLTPIAKSWPSEFGQVALHQAIQIHGGAGYTRDFEVELLYRDNRLNPIHEGTTGIQGIDLVNRKLRKEGLAAYHMLRQRVGNTLAAARPFATLEPLADALATAWVIVDQAVEKLAAEQDDALAIHHATAFLTAIGHSVVAWLWLDIAVTAIPLLEERNGANPAAYLRGKIKACAHFIELELPHVGAWLTPLINGSDTAACMRDEEFLGMVA